MRKNNLFVAPNYYGFNEVVFDGLKKYSNMPFLELVPNGPYVYNGFGERVHNFFSKTFLRRNLKKEWIKEKNQKFINKFDSFGTLIINRPDILSKSELHSLMAKSDNKILLLWDSLNKIDLVEFIPLFDIVYSFDAKDCEKYNLIKITNFYFKESIIIKQNNFDICYLGTNDNRTTYLDKFLNLAIKQQLKVKAKLFTYKSEPIKKRLPDFVEIIHKIIPFKESQQYYLDSKCILDIAHENQVGLSFRPFEAMGLKKKLITNNKEIAKYDFYNKNNILIIEKLENFLIPNDFINGKYEDLPKEIYENYNMKSWIQKILKNEK